MNHPSVYYPQFSSKLFKPNRLFVGLALLSTLLVASIPTNSVFAGSGDSICASAGFQGTTTIPDSSGAPGKQIRVQTGIVDGHATYLLYVETTNAGGGSWNAKIYKIIAGCQGPAFTDGRCNQDPDQTVAVYPDNHGGYWFYAVQQGVGYLTFIITKQQLDNYPATSTNYVIEDLGGVTLFRLTNGNLLVTGIKPDGKIYSFNIGSCGAVKG